MCNIKHSEIQGNGGVSDGTPSATLIASPGTGAYLYLQSINISVYAAAVGSGVIYLKDTDETIFHVVEATTLAKNVSIDFGDCGYKLPVGTGFAVTVAGGTTQASVSIVVKGFWKTS